MHPQITAVLNRTNPYTAKPNCIAQNNAEKVLDYIDDLNLEKNVRFRQTVSGSLFIGWSIGEWEYQMECAKNGYIIYSFLRNGYEKASGCELFDDFIPQFEEILNDALVTRLSISIAGLRC